MTDTLTRSDRSRAMAAVKGRDTAPERVVRQMAHALGYRFRLHVAALPGTPDLVFPRLRKIIDVRGCFWHCHDCGRCRLPADNRAYWQAKLERNRNRDRANAARLRRLGWRVLVVWECQTRPAAQARLRRRLAAFLGRD